MDYIKTRIEQWRRERAYSDHDMLLVAASLMSDVGALEAFGNLNAISDSLVGHEGIAVGGRGRRRGEDPAGPHDPNCRT
jgi:hypothetical protein